MNRDLIEKGVGLILLGLGEDPAREGLKETPHRVAAFYEEWARGHDYQASSFQATYGNLVILKDIPFCSLCEHHILPFTGKAHIGYIPNGQVLGLSKVVRVLNKHSRRLQIQERLTEDVATELEQITHAKGVMVVVEAEHLCMSIRGVQSPGVKTITSSIRGVVATKPEVRAEFLALLGGAR